MQYEDIKPYPKNAKKHDTKQIALLAENIKRFGFDQHIVVDKNTGYIVKGHGRWEAAKLLGIDKIKEATLAPVGVDYIPVEFKEYKSEKEANAARIADNQIHDLTGIDMDLIIAELKALEDEALVTLTGFEGGLVKVGNTLDEISDVVIDQERLSVIEVLPPESPKLKERFYLMCDTKEEYDILKLAFRDMKLNSKDIVALL